MSAPAFTSSSARDSSRSGARELALYLVAGIAYGSASLVEPYLLFNWVPALVFLLVVVWLIPALVRRLR